MPFNWIWLRSLAYSFCMKLFIFWHKNKRNFCILARKKRDIFLIAIEIFYFGGAEKKVCIML
jgi:hypothetical protein